ncbi:hypothetical protein E2C01_016942 [Portunus trituberculatus]|uniref:Uncharacterized protein n=1 Tax=Portunus trituberculatus TaxID=210409 RepID=A0A5B7DSH4_PORTR|nr:hypothetical protein [Portunus trituberculatus]
MCSSSGSHYNALPLPSPFISQHSLLVTVLYAPRITVSLTPQQRPCHCTPRSEDVAQQTHTVVAAVRMRGDCWWHTLRQDHHPLPAHVKPDKINERRRSVQRGGIRWCDGRRKCSTISPTGASRGRRGRRAHPPAAVTEVVFSVVRRASSSCSAKHCHVTVTLLKPGGPGADERDIDLQSQRRGALQVSRAPVTASQVPLGCPTRFATFYLRGSTQLSLVVARHSHTRLAGRRSVNVQLASHRGSGETANSSQHTRLTQIPRPQQSGTGRL